MQSKVKLGFSPVKIKLPFEQKILKRGRKMTFSIVWLSSMFVVCLLSCPSICLLIDLRYRVFLAHLETWSLYVKPAKVRFIPMAPLNSGTPVVTLDLGLRVSFEGPTQFSHLNCKVYSIYTQSGKPTIHRWKKSIDKCNYFSRCKMFQSNRNAIQYI